MSVEIEGTTIYTFQGDSATIPFIELPKGALIYMAIRNRKTNELVIPEIYNTVDENGNIDFELTKEMLDKIPVNLNEKYTSYYYGLKEVDKTTGAENTVLLGDNPKFGENYLFNVYRKKAEGE